MKIRRLVDVAIVVMALSLAFPGFSRAQTAPGLGRMQPNTPDVTANPQFHVYRWVLGGVTYIQVNDITGSPLLAYAASNGQVMVLPVGNPSNVQVISAATNGPAAGVIVYAAADTTVTQNTSGTFMVSSTPASSTTVPAAQTMMICQDPAECSQAVSTLH